MSVTTGCHDTASGWDLLATSISARPTEVAASGSITKVATVRSVVELVVVVAITISMTVGEVIRIGKVVVDYGGNLIRGFGEVDIIRGFEWLGRSFPIVRLGTSLPASRC